MQDQLEPQSTNFNGLSIGERGPWYKQLWESLRHLDGCKLGILASIVCIAIPGNPPTVKIVALIVIGLLAIGDEFKNLGIYAKVESSFTSQETEP